MSDYKQLAHEFMTAIATNDPACYEAVLTEDAGLRLYRWDGSEVYRPRRRVVQRLRDEWSAWPDPTLETFDVLTNDNRIGIEFRIQATENDRYVEHNRSVFLTITDGKVQYIDLYCPEAMPSARRKGWIAPATLTDEEIRRLFEMMHAGFDVREWIPPDESDRGSLRGGMGGSGLPHPGSNGVGGVRWTAAEADQRIADIIAYHRERNIGFQWWVGPYDTPADLRERLERQGMILAGDAATMARSLDNLDDIPVNPDVTIERLDGYDDAATDAMCDITRICFKWPQAQIDERRPGWVERMRDPRFRDREANYLARLNGRPVAYGRVMLESGIAYLGGAATLPEFRGQKLYSTLLRRRLEAARELGYHLAAINAEPLSRPIAIRCGFKEYARIYIYGWMPVIDLDVIKSLVPQ